MDYRDWFLDTKKMIPILIGMGFVTLCLTLILWSVFSTPLSLLSLDSPEYWLEYQRGNLVRWFNGAWNSTMLGAPSMPQFPSLDFIGLIFDTKYAHPLSYAINVFFLFGATVFLLRSMKRSWMTCITVGLAACLSGHYFTLIAAGHMSKFRMVPYAILLFGFICRSIETRKLIYFIMAGVVAGIGFSEQEDIMLMFALLALVYSIFKIVTNWPQTQSRKYILKIMGGGAIGAIFLICIMLPKIYATFLITLPVRTMLGGEVSTKEKWIFATNWSLPPEEITEFLVPCIFGTETSDPVTPYWGETWTYF